MSKKSPLQKEKSIFPIGLGRISPILRNKSTEELKGTIPTIQPSPSILEYSILYINCMNCQNLVLCSKIDQHSNLCTTVPESVKKLEISNSVDQILFKLQKLENCLLLIYTNSELKASDLNYLKIFLRYVRKLIKNSNLEVNEEILNGLTHLITSFKGSLTLKLYADRLNFLALQQKGILQEQEIRKKMNELGKIEAMNTKVLNSPHKKSIFSNSLGRENGKKFLEEINSEIDSSETSNAEISLGTSIEEDLSGDREFFIENFENDLQKHFFSLYLTSRLKVLERNKQFQIPIKKLFNNVINYNVPIDLWQEFIESQIKDSKNWKEESKRKRRIKSTTGIPKKSLNFEVIIEE